MVLLIRNNIMIYLNLRETNEVERNKTAVILFVTVLVFFICQFPHCVITIFEFIYPIRVDHHLFCAAKGRQIFYLISPMIYLADQFSINYRYCVPKIWFLLNEIGALTLALNSSVNFIIYYATGKHFREEFIRMFSRAVLVTDFLSRTLDIVKNTFFQ